jgi:hypothetical protein
MNFAGSLPRVLSRGSFRQLEPLVRQRIYS